MPKIRPFAAALTKSVRLRLLVTLFACLCLGSTAQAAEPPPAERLNVSQTLPEDASDPLRKWFQEQDRLLDDILVRLARIENLVSEIHRLVMQLPAPAQPAVSPSPAPAVAPLPVASTAPPRAPGFLDEWGYPLAGISVVFLLLMIVRRRRKAAQPKPAAPAEPDGMPAFLAEPEPAPPSPPPIRQPAPPPAPQPAAETPKETPRPVSPSSVQRAGATEPSLGQSDQALELADIMLSMGLGHGAAQTLTEQIRNEPKQALRHWLKLLAVYRQNGQQEEFERSAEELRQHFNVQPEDWQPRPEAQRSLEDYPHIAARMVELWGRPACLVYLQTLLDDNRGGSRAGFPQSVAEELLLLSAMLKEGTLGGI